MWLLDINIYAVIVAALVNILLGMIWYSPLLLGPTWARAHRLDLAVLKPTALHYLGAIIVALITAWILSAFMHWFNITDWLDGLKFGFYIWLGFIATTHFSGVIWAQKSFLSFAIDALYLLVSMLIMGAIVAAWR